MSGLRLVFYMFFSFGYLYGVCIIMRSSTEFLWGFVGVYIVVEEIVYVVLGCRIVYNDGMC